MSDLEEVTAILERYLSPVNVRVLLERALRERNLSVATFTRADIRKIGAPLRKGIELFVRQELRDDALRDIAQFCGHDSLRPAACSISIDCEADISTARNEARRVCEDAGAKSYTMHKVTTIVSELARNIVSYAKTGKVEILPLKEPKRGVAIRAVDSGPGIPDLQHVLSGRYRSKTGLGRGLIGSKRLADHFDIWTGAGGTVVLVEILL